MRMNLFLPTQSVLVRHLAATPLAVRAGLKISETVETPFLERHRKPLKTRRSLSPRKSLSNKSRS